MASGMRCKLTRMYPNFYFSFSNSNLYFQILISDTLAQTMADELEPSLSDENDDSESEEFQPKPPIQIFRWCEHKLKISILNNV